MQALSVDLGTRSYPIYVGNNTVSALSTSLPQLVRHHVFILTNTVVAPLYLPALEHALSQHTTSVYIIEDGEHAKNLTTWQGALEALLQSGFSRDCTVIALGGGVVGDIAGFVAATYHRGVDFVQIPTTLLAQVDSSVGGKTAVNHPFGKNLIGAFHQPTAVLIDTSYLQTLPERELSAGLAEVIKYGIMADEDFFTWLEQHINDLLALESFALSQAVIRSCTIKAHVVSADEREHGQRALLNLGHTFGHCIEQAQGFGQWLHGEAVAAGMAIACDIACQVGWLSHNDYQRVLRLLKSARLPISAPANMPMEQWQQLLIRDKKVQQGKVRYIIPTRIGAATVTDTLDNDVIAKAVSHQREA